MDCHWPEQSAGGTGSQSAAVWRPAVAAPEGVVGLRISSAAQIGDHRRVQKVAVLHPFQGLPML